MPSSPVGPDRDPAVLLLSCPDQPGVVAHVSDLIWRHGGNIVDAQQHRDDADDIFLQRVAFTIEDLDVPLDDFAEIFSTVTRRFRMDLSFHAPGTRPKVAILASRPRHCLADMLSRFHSGELRADLVLVISNHPDHQALCEFYGVPFRHLGVGPEGPDAQERAVDHALATAQADLVILARYMRILSPGFVGRWEGRTINIHHSFLPAFVGARPYHQAHDRGVKIIGATAHYVTAELDEGPIIEQDVARVSHRDGVADLARKGQDLEVMVLARAVRAHLERRVLVVGNRTVVFD